MCAFLPKREVETTEVDHFRGIGPALRPLVRGWRIEPVFRRLRGTRGSAIGLFRYCKLGCISKCAEDTRGCTGLTWASSDSTLVSLSTDDPPILTALAPGRITITAGGASADVIVYAGALPLGTVIWSNPGIGGNVTSIIPAVPSPTGVADVFAVQATDIFTPTIVQAITADGVTAWSATLSPQATITPDFQGGLVAFEPSLNSISKLDGLTGQPGRAYSPGPLGTPGAVALDGHVVVHTDGTIFTVQGNDQSGTQVVAIDSTTGAGKFSVLLGELPINNPIDSGLNCGTGAVFGRAQVRSLIVAAMGMRMSGTTIRS